MSSLKRMGVWNLRQGMVIVRCDKSGVPFGEYGVPLTDLDKAHALSEMGVENVYIWVDDTPISIVGKAPEDALRISMEDDLNAISLAAATELLDRSQAVVANAINDLKKGGAVDTKALNNVLEELINTAADSPGIFTNIARIEELGEAEYTHALNVCLLSLSMGQALGLSNNELMNIGLAGILHDIGKSRLPDKLLMKKERLTEQENLVFRKHPEWGQGIILRNKQISEDIATAILQHHEYCDGTGYPSGLMSKYITRIAKILAIAEAYDTMIYGGPEYNPAVHNTEAVKRIYAGIGRQFNAEIVQAFVTIMGVYPVGTIVRVSNGQLALVCEQNRKEQAKPKILLLGEDGRGEKKFINLANIDTIKIISPVRHSEFNLNPVEIFNQFLNTRIHSQLQN